MGIQTFNSYSTDNKQLLPGPLGLTLVAVAAAWLAGIILASWFPLSALPCILAAGLALILLVPYWRRPNIRLALLIVIWLLLGAWRYTIALPTNDPHAISTFIGQEKMKVRGNVTDEPKIQGRSRVLVISTSSISFDNGATWQAVHGDIEALTLDTQIESPYGPNYGDSVELQGKLQGRATTTQAGVFATMAFPLITVTASGGNPILAALFSLRVSLATVIERSLSEPNAAQLIAILLGLRTPQLKLLSPYFNATGTAHLIAPSGFKVTILAGIVTAATRWLYVQRDQPPKHYLPAEKRAMNRRRWLSTAIVIASISAYTILNGAGPSAMRAGIMGVLLVIAPRLGRTYNVYTALALSALLMSAFDPFVLQDVGFQLSFVGTLGIVVLTPPIQRLLLRSHIDRLPFGYYVAEIIAVTLAAQIATLPILMLAFNQISVVAPLTNVLTVPLLAPLIILGFLVCGTGIAFAPLGIIFGWVATPLLSYVIYIVNWCFSLPFSHFNGVTINGGLSLAYYGLLALMCATLTRLWPGTFFTTEAASHRPPLPPRIWALLLLAALFIIVATGAQALARQSDGRLTITFLSVGPTGQPPQGEAILIHTPDNKYALIDGGLDAASLAQELDSCLPPWQRSLDLVLLTSPRSDALDGLLDIVNRYQIGLVLDAGMLHPSAHYALWRRTIAERHFHYLQVRQGATIPLGTQVALQVFWPTSPLHKGSNENLDNGLIARLISPNLSVLLLGASALDKYALNNLLSTIAPQYLQADIVQIVGEAGKPFPTELSTVLQEAKPSYLIVTPAQLTPKQRKSSTILPPILPPGTWQAYEIAKKGSLEVSSSGQGWVVDP